MSKPKVATPVAATSSDKPLPVLINSGLDGRSQLSLARRGMGGLTIRRRTGTTTTTPVAPPAPANPTSPVIGGGGGGGSDSGSGLSDKNLAALDALTAMGGPTGSLAKKLKLKV